MSRYVCEKGPVEIDIHKSIHKFMRNEMQKEMRECNLNVYGKIPPIYKTYTNLTYTGFGKYTFYFDKRDEDDDSE